MGNNEKEAVVVLNRKNSTNIAPLEYEESKKKQQKQRIEPPAKVVGSGIESAPKPEPSKG